MMTDSESGAIIGLLKRLSGEVCVFLSDEQERRTLISNEKMRRGTCAIKPHRTQPPPRSLR